MWGVYSFCPLKEISRISIYFRMAYTLCLSLCVRLLFSFLLWKVPTENENERIYINIYLSLQKAKNKFCLVYLYSTDSFKYFSYNIFQLSSSTFLLSSISLSFLSIRVLRDFSPSWIFKLFYSFYSHSLFSGAFVVRFFRLFRHTHSYFSLCSQSVRYQTTNGKNKAETKQRSN